MAYLMQWMGPGDMSKMKTMLYSVVSVLAAGVLMGGCDPDVGEGEQIGEEGENEREQLAEQEPPAAQERDEAVAEIGDKPQVSQSGVSFTLNMSYTEAEKYAFGTVSNGDVIAMQFNGTTTGTVRAARFTAQSGFQTDQLNWTSTALHELPVSSDHTLKTDADGNIYYIKSGGACGSTEVHVLDVNTNYQTFTHHTCTALHQTAGGPWLHNICKNGDLCSVNQLGASGTTELHTLTKASNYQTFSVHTTTGLHQTGSNFKVIVDQRNNDLIFTKLWGTGSGKTEIHTLSSSSGWKDFSGHWPIDRPENTSGGEQWIFGGGGATVITRDPVSNKPKMERVPVPKTVTQCGVTLTEAAGGDDAYSGYVQLGATSGTLQITYNTQNIKDRVVLKKDGVAIHDSGCVGTGGNASASIPFFGYSTFAVLEVYPNCAGETGTAWSVTVGCPS